MGDVATEPHRVAGLPFPPYLWQNRMGPAFKRIDLHG
jgi:hypothetical protein